MSETAMTRPDARLSSLRLAFARIGLPAWFVVIDLLWIVRPITFAIDARHYQRAASVWLAGGDPWSVYESNIGYASGPHTLLLYAPTSLLPLVISVAIWMLIGTGVAFWILRRLGLPVWWFAFPPLFHAVWNGNPQTLMLALLLLATPLAAAAASAVKLYALVPLLFRPRHLVVACLFLAVTLLILPWRLYLDAGGGVSGHLADAWNGSAWRLPFLVVPTAIALWVLRRDGADWWSIPAIWPDPVLLRVVGLAGRRRSAVHGGTHRRPSAVDDADHRHRARDPDPDRSARSSGLGQPR
jgi:hypothetical protein